MVKNRSIWFRLFLGAVFSIKAMLPLLLCINYQWQQAYIAQTYCINKARPKLNCNGKCHLAKQLNKVSETDSGQQAPTDKKVASETNEYWLPTEALLLVSDQHGFVFPLNGAESSPSNGFPLGVFHPPMHIS
jgi:hypothetical protein